MHEPIPPETEQAAAALIDAAFAVHRGLGPGLVEPVYEKCLLYELDKRGVPFRTQVYLPVVYDGIQLDAALRLDVLVADRVIGELKAVEKLIPLNTAQLLTYLKLTKLRLGILINFNVPVLKDGIKRVIL